jgi:hypothetical protein
MEDIRISVTEDGAASAHASLDDEQKRLDDMARSIWYAEQAIAMARMACLKHSDAMPHELGPCPCADNEVLQHFPCSLRSKCCLPNGQTRSTALPLTTWKL